MPGVFEAGQPLNSSQTVKPATGDQQLSPDLSNPIEDPPAPKQTAVPVASRDGGARDKSNVNSRIYTPLSLPDKAALASDIAADRRLRPSDKIVAFALLFRFHNTKAGQCNPSYEILAQSCSLTRRAVINAVGRLEVASWLTVERTNGGRNRRNNFGFKAKHPQTVNTKSSKKSTRTVKTEGENSEPAITGESEWAFTGKEAGKLNTGKERRNQYRSNEGFERFWSEYPRKVSKKLAERLFDRILRRQEATADELISGAKLYAEQCRENQTEPRFIKHPSTWLRAGCWDDEAPPSPALCVQEFPNNLSAFSEAVLRRACGRRR